MNLPYTVPKIAFPGGKLDVVLDVEFDIDWRNAPDEEDTVTVLGIAVTSVLGWKVRSLAWIRATADAPPLVMAAMCNDPDLGRDIAQKCLEYARELQIDAACE